MTSQGMAREVLLEEFATYYQADELSLFTATGLPDWVDNSASRIVQFHADVGSQVANLLREMASDATHPLFQTIENQTMFGWNGDPESWGVFQQIAQQMADAIAVALEEHGDV